MKKHNMLKNTARIFAVLSIPFMLIGVVAALGKNNTVQAAPGNPGVPEAPSVIYNEDFENSPSLSPIPLLSYTGDSTMTYTANSAWRSNCNGEVLFFNMADDQFANTNCDDGNGTNLTGAYDAVRRLAYALGTLHSGSSPSTNRALTAYTDNGALYVDPGDNLVQFETVDRVNLGSGNRRFVISNIDIAAINCTNQGTAQGKLRFYLLDNTTPRQINQTLINICTDSAATSVTPPTLDSNGALGPNTGSIRVGSVFTDRALLSDTNLVGIRMINEEESGQGNDNAIDNIQLADASPKLDKAFSPESVLVNETSTMTFTVTNTTDLLAKEGWSFTDNLPENLVIAQAPNFATTCPNGAAVAQPGAISVDYNGDLTAGMTSCTISIDVTSSEAGTYTNGPANLVNVVGLQLPADAQVIFAPLAPDTGDKNSGSMAIYTAVGLSALGIGSIVRRKLQIKKR